MNWIPFTSWAQSGIIQTIKPKNANSLVQDIMLNENADAEEDVQAAVDGAGADPALEAEPHDGGDATEQARDLDAGEAEAED